MGKQWNVGPETGHEALVRLREDVRAELVALGADPSGDGELLAWELVTNALRHTDGPVAVLVVAHGARVRVEVVDSSRDHPLLRNPDPERDGGHGIELVDDLSVDWGEEELGDGKAVWFDVPAAQDGAHSAAGPLN